jgi:beta-N-acetylhexosaminidase
MLDLEGLELTAPDRERLSHPLVGGVILFSRNYESPEQLERLVTDIHAQRHPKLLVAVDHEGGRVQRFRSQFTKLPPMRPIGALYDKHPKEAKRVAHQAGWVMAKELRAVGVDFSFAPVLDLDKGMSEVIGDRAFHSNAEIVAELASDFVRGMHQAGMAATGKHFPGHGNVVADSHAALPVDTREFADILTEDLLPFERLVRAGIEGIMPAHVIYQKVDPRPAGFSPYWLQTVLRSRLGFQGVIFSDDLSMEGAKSAFAPSLGSNSPLRSPPSIPGVVTRAQTALAAGCDMVLVCNDLPSADRLLDGLGPVDNPVSHLRLVRMHGRGEEGGRLALAHDRHYVDAVRAVVNLSSG